MNAMQFYKLNCGYQTHAKSYKESFQTHRIAQFLRLSDWFVTSAIILYCRLIGSIVLRCVSQPITAHFLELFINFPE